MEPVGTSPDPIITGSVPAAEPITALDKVGADSSRIGAAVFDRTCAKNNGSALPLRVAIEAACARAAASGPG